MQRIKILGVALTVMFTLGMAISATASAAVSVLPATAEKWTGEGGTSTFESLKSMSVAACKKTKWEGTIEENKPLGQFHITLEGCKAVVAPCTGLGDAKEIILSLGVYHLVFDTLAVELKDAGIGILFLLEATHFECGGKLLVVSGEVLCLLKDPNKKEKHFEIVCKKGTNMGDPGETVYWDEGGTEVKMGEEGLLTKENEGVGSMSGENLTA